MVFSSVEFLLAFLPMFLIGYNLCPKQYKNLCLFCFSVAFYAYGAIKTPLYILLILVSIFVNYLFGFGVSEHSRHRKLFLILALVYNFGWLILFKYSYFLHLLPFKLVLPVGISFYTFQIVSYIADVYMLRVKPEKSLLRLGTYVIMFPQLIAGPIVRFVDVNNQLKKRSFSEKQMKEGIMVFILGLGSKVVLANQIGNIWSDVNHLGFESISVPFAWLGIIAYSFQLYFDFYGYSLMAIGLGRMAGFELPENFREPYTSVTMTEFWRRWHITLGTWFREYVYIPLGGNRRGEGRTYFNMLVVWLFTGFWHGADWNFILWGLLLFVIMVAEKRGLYDYMNNHRAAGHLYMAFLIPLSWMFFAIDDMKQLAIYAGRLVGIGGQYVYAKDWISSVGSGWWLFVLALICSTDLPKNLYYKYKDSPVIYVPLAITAAMAGYCLYKGMNDPFMYFRF